MLRNSLSYICSVIEACSALGAPGCIVSLFYRMTKPCSFCLQDLSYLRISQKQQQQQTYTICATRMRPNILKWFDTWQIGTGSLLWCFLIGHITLYETLLLKILLIFDSCNVWHISDRDFFNNIICASWWL